MRLTDRASVSPCAQMRWSGSGTSTVLSISSGGDLPRGSVSVWPVATNTHTPDATGIIASARGDTFQTPETNSTASSLSGKQ